MLHIRTLLYQRLTIFRVKTIYFILNMIIYFNFLNINKDEHNKCFETNKESIFLIYYNIVHQRADHISKRIIQFIYKIRLYITIHFIYLLIEFFQD